MSYTKTNWQNGATPAINADNLNHMEQGIYDAHERTNDYIKKVSKTYAISGTVAQGEQRTAHIEITDEIPDGYTPLAVVNVVYKPTGSSSPDTFAVVGFGFSEGAPLPSGTPKYADATLVNVGSSATFNGRLTFDILYKRTND